MGNVEDVRKVFQDFIAPDLKVLSERIESLGKEMNFRFVAMQDSIDVRFAAMDVRFATLEKSLDGRFAAMKRLLDGAVAAMQKSQDGAFATMKREIDLRFIISEQTAVSRHEALLAAMSTHQTGILQALDLEGRLARLEDGRNRTDSPQVRVRGRRRDSQESLPSEV